MGATNIYRGLDYNLGQKSDQEICEEARSTNNLIHGTGNLIPSTTNDVTQYIDVNNEPNKTTEKIE